MVKDAIKSLALLRAVGSSLALVTGEESQVMPAGGLVVFLVGEVGSPIIAPP